MTTAQVVETSVTVNNNSPIQDYVHPDDQTQPVFFQCVILGNRGTWNIEFHRFAIYNKQSRSNHLSTIAFNRLIPYMGEKIHASELDG